MTKALVCDYCGKVDKVGHDLIYPWSRLTQTSFAGTYSQDFCSLECLVSGVAQIAEYRADLAAEA